MVLFSANLDTFIFRKDALVVVMYHLTLNYLTFNYYCYGLKLKNTVSQVCSVHTQVVCTANHIGLMHLDRLCQQVMPIKGSKVHPSNNINK